MTRTPVTLTTLSIVWNIHHPYTGKTITVIQYRGVDNTAIILIEDSFTEFVHKGALALGEWSRELESAVDSLMDRSFAQHSSVSPGAIQWDSLLPRGRT